MMISWPTSASQLVGPHGTRETVSKGYGDWLFWLEGQNHLDPAAAPEDRCSPADLLAYVQSLQARVSPATVAHRVIALERALCALAPHSDRSHLRRLINNLPKQGVTSRKRARLQEPADLVELGVKLMRGAEQGVHNDARKNACVYRDGLRSRSWPCALCAARTSRKWACSTI